MARILPLWCKKVKCELVNRDMSITQLAEQMGKSREYISGVINGRVYSETAVKEISDALNVPETYFSLSDN